VRPGGAARSLRGRKRNPQKASFEAALPPPQFLRQLVAAVLAAVLLVFLPIRSLGLLEQFRDLALQPLLFLFHAVIAHRFVAARIRFDLRPIDGHPSQLDQPAALGDQNHLLEQPDEFLKVFLAKITDRPMLRKVPGRQHPVRHVLFDLLGDTPRRERPYVLRASRALSS
jgi:hypothetical protein